MANDYINFYNTMDAELKDPSGQPKTVEKIDKNTISNLYTELDNEIRQRGGYQSIAPFRPEEYSDANTWYNNSDNPDSEDEGLVKVRVRHFNKAMKTRPYIKNGGTDEFFELDQLGFEQIKDTVFVLVAGGLGERLGYTGIKIGLQNDLITLRTYIEVYTDYIKAYEDRIRKKEEIF